MNIEFSEHAISQLKRRNIAKKYVTKAIEYPQEIIKSFRERKLHRLRIDDKLLEVVTKKEGSTIIVITAYYLEE